MLSPAYLVCFVLFVRFKVFSHDTWSQWVLKSWHKQRKYNQTQEQQQRRADPTSQSLRCALCVSAHSLPHNLISKRSFFFSWQSPSLFFNNGKIKKANSRQFSVFSSSPSDEDIGASVDLLPIWFKFVFVLYCGRLERKIKARIDLHPPARQLRQTADSPPGRHKFAFKVKAVNLLLYNCDVQLRWLN